MKLNGIIQVIGVLLIITLASSEAKLRYEWCSGNYLRRVVNRCAAAYGATNADLNDYLNLRWAASEGAKCFRACLFTECRVYNRDGSFAAGLANRAAYLTSHRDISKWAITVKLVTYCGNTIPIYKNRCDTTEAFIRCVTSRSPVKLTLEGLL